MNSQAFQVGFVCAGVELHFDIEFAVVSADEIHATADLLGQAGRKHPFPDLDEKYNWNSSYYLKPGQFYYLFDSRYFVVIEFSACHFV